MKNVIKAPYYKEEYQMWGVEVFNTSGYGSGKNTMWHATQEQAQKTFDGYVKMGFEIVEEVEAQQPIIKSEPVVEVAEVVAAVEIDEIKARANALFEDAQTALNDAVAAYENAATKKDAYTAYRLAKIAQRKAAAADVPASKYFPFCDGRVFDLQTEAHNVAINARLLINS